jgi:ATP-dependent DNA ligase
MSSLGYSSARLRPRSAGLRFTRCVQLTNGVEGDGRLLFEQIVAMDLEGIVCKRKDSSYHVTEKPSSHWIKVKNPKYSQLDGREELFEHI